MGHTCSESMGVWDTPVVGVVVTIHQWHGSVRFTVLEPRFGSVRFCLLWGRVHVILPAILKEQ